MKVVLLKEYRPLDVKGEAQPQYQPGTELDLPDEEAKVALDLKIAQTPEDYAMDPNERSAVAYLTDLGYTVTSPKPDKPSVKDKTNG